MFKRIKAWILKIVKKIKKTNFRETDLRESFFWFFILILICVVFFITLKDYMKEKNGPHSLSSEFVPEDIPTITYSEFEKMLDAGSIDALCYNPNEPYMWFVTGDETTDGMTENEILDHVYDESAYYQTQYPASENFREHLLKDGVVLIFSTEKDSSSGLDGLFSLATAVIPMFVLIAYMFLLAKKLSGDKISLDDVASKSTVTFDDVIGQDEILEDIRFISDIIKYPDKCVDMGASIPKGILLSGAPGVGKTLIAKAIAGEADVPFYSISGSDFKEMYVGVGARRVRDLFSQARKNAPCVVFIDEIDAVGIKRDRYGSSSEDDQTINALLKEMDGFSGREGVFVIAATNRPEQLDKALIRSGRFDRQIVINPPHDWKVRKDLFSHYLKDMRVSDDTDFVKLSKQTAGFTGADIASVCNEAALIAMMNKKNVVDKASIEDAIDKKVFHGNKSRREQLEKDREVVAYHESGHAVMAYLTGSKLTRASIQGTTSGVGGYISTEENPSCFTTDKEMENHILIAYAGRASEEIKFGEVTTGASNDITQATHLLMSYIYQYGFCSETFGLIDLSVLRDQSLFDSSSIAGSISNMSIALYDKCSQFLKEHYDLVKLLATKLIEAETLSGDEIHELLDQACDENNIAKETEIYG